MCPPVSSLNPSIPVGHARSFGPGAGEDDPGLHALAGPAASYQHDAITLYQADATVLLPRLACGSVDVVIADPPPPPGLSATANGPGWDALMAAAGWHARWLAACRPLLRPHGVVWLFGSWRTFPVLARASLEAGWPPASVLVWDKQSPRLGHARGLRPCYDLILHLPGPAWRPADRSIRDVCQHPWPARRHATRHPQQKPVGLLRRLLEASHHPSQVLLDPFSGSGSALVAAHQLGIAAVGIELDAHWCQVAAARLEAAALASNLGEAGAS